MTTIAPLDEFHLFQFKAPEQEEIINQARECLNGIKEGRPESMIFNLPRNCGKTYALGLTAAVALSTIPSINIMVVSPSKRAASCILETARTCLDRIASHSTETIWWGKPNNKTHLSIRIGRNVRHLDIFTPRTTRGPEDLPDLILIDELGSLSKEFLSTVIACTLPFPKTPAYIALSSVPRPDMTPIVDFRDTLRAVKAPVSYNF